jgi:L-aspartate oxidase
MLNYDERGDLASRDIVSQSIEIELKKSGDDCVYLDCTHLNFSGFINHFPMIYTSCKAIGIDLEKDWIPVIPAQHYLCGGISVTKNGQTSIENLFACGECSRTGLHGANRLASNSLLEALVYSDRIYTFLSNSMVKKDNTKPSFPEWILTNTEIISSEYTSKTRLKLQILMQQKAGIVRNDSDLELAKNQLENWKNECIELEKTKKINKDFYELKNMIEVSLLIVNQSLNRKENRGGFVKNNS